MSGTGIEPRSTPVVAAVMQYIANVLGNNVAGAKKLPELSARSNVSGSE
jgi:hypothetical protein